ncbi:MAG: Gfo/Idh/MocA family oxidoreductase [Kutzneria sp.]|nr:Gfo/Idh/MocA family oxidoreductase [Kutzneria sp.]MBV9845962.1 Gfo/Idh/MocA family oxidoreductase [Kutzneria sp.]
MRIGIAGVGRVGAMHAANLVALGKVRQVVLFDPVPGRAAQLSASLGPDVGHVDTADELLATSDAMVVATPTTTHPELLRRGLSAKLPMLCEKPIAGDLVTMSAIVEEIETAGVDVVVGFQRRFDPAFTELRRRIRAGDVGTVYLVRALGHDAQPPDFEYLPTSGGIFRDLFVHDLDVVPWLVGEPVVEVYASGSVLVHEAFADVGDVDNAVVTLRFANGTHALLAGGRHNALGYDHRVEVLGSKDSLAVGLDPRTPLTSLEPDGPKVGVDAYPGFPERFRNAYLNEMAVFVDVVAGRVENPSPARDSLVSLRLADACERSRLSGAPVRLLVEAVS